MKKCDVLRPASVSERAFFALLVLLMFVASCTFFIRRPMIPDAQKREVLLKRVPIHTRDEWGATDTTSGWVHHAIQRITLHHGGVPFQKNKKVTEYLRNLQNWSRQEKGWPDIPYHFIVDLDGEIWEARPLQYAGDTNTDYNTRGHVLVCVLGNYEEQEPTEKQLRALVQLFAALCRIYGVSPHTIRGHRDYTSQTVCPGRNLYRYLENGWLVEEVKKALTR